MKRRRGQNEGSIFERSDGRWCGVLTLATKDDGTGRRRRTRRYFYGATAAEVQDQMTPVKNDILNGVPIPTDGLRVGDFLATWLDQSVKPNVRPLTFQQYSDHIRLHLAPRMPKQPGQAERFAPLPGLGNFTLAKLKPEHVQSLVNSMLKSGLSPRTAQLSLVILRLALDRAVKWGRCARNVAKLVDAPRVERHEVRVLNPDEARGFLSECSGERLEALYSVALALGLRLGEALGLRWQDVDFEHRTLTVAQALARIGSKRFGAPGTLQFVEPKTKRSRRTIVAPEGTLRALKTHRARQAQERLAAGADWRDLGLVFTTRVGTPFGPRDAELDFKRILEKAGLPGKIRFHDLRHSAASLLLAQGVEMRVIMELLGHSTITLTADTYSHVLPVLMEDAAAKMESVLGARRCDTSAVP